MLQTVNVKSNRLLVTLCQRIDVKLHLPFNKIFISRYTMPASLHTTLVLETNEQDHIIASLSATFLHVMMYTTPYIKVLPFDPDSTTTWKGNDISNSYHKQRRKRVGEKRKRRIGVTPQRSQDGGFATVFPYALEGLCAAQTQPGMLQDNPFDFT